VPARLWRSTGPIDRHAQNVHAGQPLEPVDRLRHPTLGWGCGRPIGRP